MTNQPLEPQEPIDQKPQGNLSNWLKNPPPGFRWSPGVGTQGPLPSIKPRPPQETPFISADEMIDRMPNAELLSPLERWMYKALPRVMERQVFGQPLGKWFEKFDNSWAGRMLNVIDIPAEGIERGLGFISQWQQAQAGTEEERLSFENHLADAWYAGSLFADMTRLPKVKIGVDGEMLGVSIPAELPGAAALVEARRQISDLVDGGMDYSEALKITREEYYNNLGALAIRAQFQDMFQHIFLDPLNWAGPAFAKAFKLRPVELLQAKRIAAITGKLDNLDDLIDIEKGFREANRLEDAAKVAERIASLQDAPRMTIGDKVAVWITGGDPFTPSKIMASRWNPVALSPEARAFEMLTMVSDNADAYILSRYTDPETIMEVLQRARDGSLGAEFGHAFLTPEGRLAKAGIDAAQASAEDLFAKYMATRAEGEVVQQIAALLDENIEDVVRMFDEDKIPMLVERLSKVQGGGDIVPKITDEFIDIVKTFNKEKIPFTPQLFKLHLSNAIRDATARLAVARFGVESRGLILRFSHAMKSAETLAFLRLNPTFVAKNSINNWITSIARDVGGFVPEHELDELIEAIGFVPHRYEQAFTIAGEQMGVKMGVGEQVIIDALRGDRDMFTKIDSFFQKAGDKLPKWADMGNFATKAEAKASRRAFYHGYLQGWNRYFWKPGHGYSRISQVVPSDILETIPTHIQKLIEDVVGSAMNENELAVLTAGKNINLNAKAIVDDVIREYGYDLNQRMPAPFMEKLNRQLTDAMPQGTTAVRRVIDNARETIQKHLDDLADGRHQSRIDELATITEAGYPTSLLTIWGDALDEFHGGVLAHDIRFSKIEPSRLTGELADIFWKRTKGDAEKFWGRQWRRLDEVLAGVEQAGDRMGVKIPKGLRTNFKKWSGGWKKYINNRNRLHDQFFEAILAKKKPPKEWGEITAILEDEYRAMLELEYDLTQNMDDLLVKMVQDNRPEVANAFAAWRKRARELRVTDRENLADFRQTLDGLSPNRKEEEWRIFWQNRQEPHIDLWKTKRAGLAALKGDQKAATGLNGLDDLTGASRENALRAIANMYGIPGADETGVPINEAIVGIVNKYLNGEYEGVANTTLAEARRYIDQLPKEQLDELAAFSRDEGIDLEEYVVGIIERVKADLEAAAPKAPEAAPVIPRISAGDEAAKGATLFEPDPNKYYRDFDSPDEILGADVSISKGEPFGTNKFLVELSKPEGAELEEIVHHAGTFRGNIEDYNVDKIYYHPEFMAEGFEQEVFDDLARLQARFPDAEIIRVGNADELGLGTPEELAILPRPEAAVPEGIQPPTPFKSQEITDWWDELTDEGRTQLVDFAESRGQDLEEYLQGELNRFDEALGAVGAEPELKPIERDIRRLEEVIRDESLTRKVRTRASSDREMLQRVGNLAYKDGQPMNEYLDELIAGGANKLETRGGHAYLTGEGQEYHLSKLEKDYVNYRLENPLPEAPAIPAAEPIAAEIAELATEPPKTFTKSVDGTTWAWGVDAETKYPMRFEVRELDELIPSHTDDFKPTPGYPPEIQPRIRNRTMSELQINKITQEFNPEWILYDSRLLEHGPMIIGPSDNFIEAGNGRVMALRRIAKEYPEKWAEYQDELRKILPEYGLDTAQLEGMQNPVLVRVRTSDVNRAEFARATNPTREMKYGTLERALLDAERIGDEVIANLSVPKGMALDKILNSTANRKAIRAWLDKVPFNEQGDLVDSAGNLSIDGISRFRSALFARTFPGEAGAKLVSIFTEMVDDVGIKNIENALTGALPDLAKFEAGVQVGKYPRDLAIGDDLAKVVDFYARLKDQGLPVSSYLKQGSFVGRELDEFQDILLQYINDNIRSYKRIQEMLVAYTEAASKEAAAGQGVLFEGIRTAKKEIMRDAIKALEPEELPLFAKMVEGAEAPRPDTAPIETPRGGLEEPAPGLAERVGGVPEEAGAGQAPQPEGAAAPEPVVAPEVPQGPPPQQYENLADIPPTLADEAFEAQRKYLGKPEPDRMAFGEPPEPEKTLTSIVDTDDILSGYAAGNPPTDVVEDQHWFARGLASLDDIEAQAVERINRPPVSLDDLTPEQTAEVNKYLRMVEGQMADARVASVRYGEFKRDSALLNYNRRYNYNNWFSVIWPFEFWTTQSLAKWALHSIDRPAMLTSYLRLKKFIETAGMEQNGFPSRLQGSLKIELPFLPDFMGTKFFVNPLRWMLPFDSWGSLFEQYQTEMQSEEGRAIRLLANQLDKGEISQAEADEAINTRAGSVWENALAQARINDYEGRSDAWDYASMLLSPHAPYVWGKELLIDKTPEEIGPFLPISRTFKQAAGLLGIDTAHSKYNVAGNIRKMLGLPAFDQWDDYRVDRELSNMAAEGYNITDIKLAMINRSGPLWEQAIERAAKAYSGGGLIPFITKVLGVPTQTYPEGEEHQRTLQDEFNKAYESYDNGNVEALTNFFNAYPEYEARLALWDEPEERLHQFLVDNIWDKYHQLPWVHKNQIEDALGLEWEQFISSNHKATGITNEQLQTWFKLMGGDPPGSLNSATQPLELADADEAWRVQQFYELRGSLFPHYKELQDTYFKLSEEDKDNIGEMWAQIESELGDVGALWDQYWELKGKGGDYRSFYKKNKATFDRYYEIKEDFDRVITPSARKQFLRDNPELKSYWDWRRDIFHRNPAIVPYLDDDFEFEYESVEDIPTQTDIPIYTFEEWSYVLGSRSVANVVVTGDIPETAMPYLEDIADQLDITINELVALVGESAR